MKLNDLIIDVTSDKYTSGDLLTATAVDEKYS